MLLTELISDLNLRGTKCLKCVIAQSQILPGSVKFAHTLVHLRAHTGIQDFQQYHS